MKKTILIIPLFLLLLAGLTYAAPNSAPRIHIKAGSSTNWAGYAALTDLISLQQGSVSDVNGSWIVPKVNCSVTPNAYSSFWVGIDGYSSNTVEQTGTDSDCSSGSARYYAWYEMYPKFPVNLNMKISPGDSMNAEIKYIGNNKFQITIIDTTTGASYTTTQQSKKASRTSAEWIAEAPSSMRGVLPLADFSNVNFLNAQATINGVSGAINHWQYDAITMATTSGTVKAQPSSLSSSGTSFSVAWQHQ
jgi:Peptidase A4 family